LKPGIEDLKLALSDRVELANEQNVLWRLDFCRRKITYHLQGQRLSSSFYPSSLPLRNIFRIFDIFSILTSSALLLLGIMTSLVDIFSAI
jgi:hypothetical protein